MLVCIILNIEGSCRMQRLCLTTTILQPGQKLFINLLIFINLLLKGEQKKREQRKRKKESKW